MIPKKYLPEDRLRQKIVQGSPELRQLAAQLEQAYVNKERSAQVAERQRQRQEEERERQYENDILEQERINNIKAENDEIRDDNIRRLRYQKELDDQLQMIQEERNKIFKQFLEEKSMIDSIIARIHAENEQNMIRKFEEKKQNQEHIQNFIQSQQVWRSREEEKVAKEEENIKRFLSLKEARDLEIMKREQEQRLIKNDKVLKLAEEMSIQEKEKEERENILFELQQITREEEDRRKDEAELEREIKKKIDLREANILANQFRNERLIKEKNEEEAWKQKMMEKFAEDDKIEQMNAQKRRMKKEEHKRCVAELLQQRKDKKAEEKERELDITMNMAREQEKHRALLEEEKKRILSQHLEKLRGHIPRGIISQADLNEITEELNL